MLLPLDEIVSNCAIATLKILILCLGGVLLARNGVLSESQVRALSKVSQDLLIPCLIFSNFVSINSKQIIAYSPVVLIAIAMIFIGIYVGKFVGRYFVRQERYSMMLQVVCGFPHTLNIQLAMVETLGHLLDKLDVLAGQTYAVNAESRGIIFTMILTIVNTIIRWSVLTKLIKENEKEAIKSGTGSSFGRSLEMRLLSSRGKEIRLIDPLQPEESTEVKSSFWKSFLEVMNPPLFMTLLAVVIALIPPVQHVFISESSLVYQLVTKVIIFLGQASSPILLVLLGANFGNPRSKGDKPSAFVIGSVTFAKMVVMPAIGFIFILALQTLSLMNDATMMIVILSAFAAPTANNILIQYANLGKEMGAVSKMVLATYVCSVVTLPATLVIFLSTYTIY